MCMNCDGPFWPQSAFDDLFWRTVRVKLGDVDLKMDADPVATNGLMILDTQGEIPSNYTKEEWEATFASEPDNSWSGVYALLPEEEDDDE